MRYTVYIFSRLPVFIFALLLCSSCFFGGWFLKPNIIQFKPQLDELNRKVENLSDVNNKLYMQNLRLTNLADDNEKLADVNKKISNRLALLGCLFNENFAAIRNDNVIFMERDWKISKMPRYLNMSKEDIQWLSNFLVRNANKTIPTMPNP